MGGEEDKDVKGAAVDGESRVLELRNGKFYPKDEEVFPDNLIRTSKYRAYNFFIYNLIEQILRPANAYFIFVAVLQSIKSISISQGSPTILMPLIFVVGVSMVKDAFEDYKRHQADKKENETEFTVVRMDGQLHRVESANICVGEILQIADDEVFPADLLLLSSGTEDGSYCYVETANLDGETNLKIKMVPEFTKHAKKVDDLLRINMTVKCDPPHGKLDAWGGILSMNGKETLLGLDHLLLRGAKLRNTGIIFGLVVYTGEQTKIRMNSLEKKKNVVKRSRVEKYANRQMIGTVFMQLIVCLGAGIGAGVWEASNKSHSYYLLLTDNPSVVGVLRFFTWFIIFAYLVPISLLVSMEMVKFWQGMFIGWDLKMMHVIQGEKQFARAQTSGLNEELGYVQYVLSDKTGTLTENKMDFRKCVIGGIQFGTGETDISRAAKMRGSFSGKPNKVTNSEEDVEGAAQAPHVHFNARNQMLKYLRTENSEGRLIDEYLLALALSNTVFPTLDKQGNPILKASSPDEQALVEFARFMGYELYERNSPNVTIRLRPPDIKGSGGYRTYQYEQLAVLDFTSKRKRMSVVMRCPDSKIRVYCKGADSIVEQLLKGYGGDLNETQPNWNFTMDCLADFGDQGLRTLLVAVAVRDPSWWDDPVHGWAIKYSERIKEVAVEGPAEEGHFKGSCKDNCRRCALESDIEKDCGLNLIGATAIEDKLQDQVPQTIKAMLEAGINVWVLTGDKLETAINIGMACNLLESSMERKGNLLRIDGNSKEQVVAQIDAAIAHVRHLREVEQSSDLTGLVVTSQAVEIIVKKGVEFLQDDEKEIFNKFLWVATRCKSVVGCRMQPNQKAQIVNLVKTTQNSITLGIGDGANDEQMIREAHVGVGIRGVEGTTAVRAADYAISQFKFLRRLLFVHGRLNYRRVSLLISYIFYKNTLVCFIPLWYGLYSGFSGQPIFLTWAFQGYNIFFTAFPIIVVAALDRDVEFETLERNPKLYRQSQQGAFFNVIVFWKWIILGLIQSLIIFFIPLAIYDTTSMDDSGQSFGLWEVGIVIYTITVLVVNLKLAMLTASWNWLNQVTMWGSIIVYFICMWILNLDPMFSNAGADYTYSLYRLWSSARCWFTIILCTIMALFIDWVMYCLEQLGLASKLLPQSWEEWLLKTFPLAAPPSPQYLPKSLPEPKRIRKESQPEMKSEEKSPQRESHVRQKTHTGFDFDYTPKEGSRIERRSSSRLAPQPGAPSPYLSHSSSSHSTPTPTTPFLAPPA